jgi:hypothetical protein
MESTMPMTTFAKKYQKITSENTIQLKKSLGPSKTDTMRLIEKAKHAINKRERLTLPYRIWKNPKSS